MTISKTILGILLMFCISVTSYSTARPDRVFKIYQFPINQIPRIDGQFSDWEKIPDTYTIGLEELNDTRFGNGTNLDPSDYDIDVKVAWVKGLNRLYFYIDAYDDYWDFDHHALGQDIFELVVDGDLSGGTFINQHNGNKNLLSKNELHYKGHGSHAQNYHIFTPVQNKDWAMVWGNTPWIKEFPHYNSASAFDFEHGESGRLQMEFYITPFDHAAFDGFSKSSVSQLKEDDFIGLAWCILDFDGKGKCEAFMNIAHDTKMIYDASYLCAFRLMPLEPEWQKPIAANWSFLEVDRSSRWIQFKDESQGKIEKWHWDFGDNTNSTEQHPKHIYKQGGTWTVTLTVEGPAGKSIRSKVWDVVTQ
ncbi:PKD domain-containing protein [Marinoscillum furvescens]|uniref:PKD domain-containing protein n=1 Tax=Marinoscillum furvescens DSM 4134 TaxID=1122208 RepID=A0A3D9L2V9_MARFU|nr:PKD domain-containing protein [Marinoscillum furvescens]RED98346.1 PKD domain-containing protein [Marinoscillum furvescens DSM 4134]